MAWLALLLPFQMVLVLTALRYRNAVAQHVWPVIPPGAWGVLGGAATVLTVVLWVRGWRRSGTRALVELLIVFGAGAILLWGLMPSGRPQVVHWVAVAALAGVVGVFLARGERGIARDLIGPHFGRALKLLAVPTLVTLIAAGAIALAQEEPPKPFNLLLSLVGYPVYALGQLMLFVVFALPRLRACGASHVAQVMVVAGLFALAHWPNPLLLVSCLVAMAFWSWVHLRAPSLAAVALSMGLAATAWTQLLPDVWTRHARVGPGYVLHEHLHHEFLGKVQLVDELSTPEFYQEIGGTTDALIQALFRRVLSREPTEEEQHIWRGQAEILRRETIARDMLTGPEYRQRFGALPRGESPGGDPRSLSEPLPGEVPPDVEGRVHYYSSVGWFRLQGESFRQFLVGSYKEILERTTSPAELDRWSPQLDRFERGRVVRRFFQSETFQNSEMARRRGSAQLGPLVGSRSPRRQSYRPTLRDNPTPPDTSAGPTEGPDEPHVR